MAEYSVGIATRNKIYETAKHFFYEKGIKATSYSDICAAADVNRGLIPYYFKSKANIANEVLKEFYQGLEDAVDEHWGKGELPLPVWHVVIELLMFKLLSQNENILNFYGEVFCSDDFHETSLAEQDAVLRSMAGDSCAGLSEAALQTIVCMTNGVEGELVLALKENRIIEEVEEFVRRDVLLLNFLIGADIDEANAHCDAAFDAARGLTFECGPDFRCHVVKE